MLASLLIVLDIAWAFSQVPQPASSWKFGICAIVAVLHDVLVVVVIFSLLGHFAGVEVDSLFVTAVLTVIGFSVHDTIVVFDRIRENFRKVRKGAPIEVINLSINQTLSRTLMTSFMTLLVVLALLFFGGESLFGFSTAFFVGIIIGTFSSIYVSGALALWMGLSRTDLMVSSLDMRQSG